MGRANPFRYFLNGGQRCEVVAEEVMLWGFDSEAGSGDRRRTLCP
jgi:hypothetical protein